MVPAVTTLDQADSQTFEAVVLLYIASSKLPDGDLADKEAKRVVTLTARHAAELAPGYAEQVVHDVAAGLAASTDIDQRLAKVVKAAEHLATALDDDAKRTLVDELKSIARADGVVTDNESAFVDAAAKTLGVAQR